MFGRRRAPINSFLSERWGIDKQESLFFQRYLTIFYRRHKGANFRHVNQSPPPPRRPTTRHLLPAAVCYILCNFFLPADPYHFLANKHSVFRSRDLFWIPHIREGLRQSVPSKHRR
eukprot:scaffold1750_cov189-Alexandrium_tamarense.AAC.3